MESAQPGGQPQEKESGSSGLPLAPASNIPDFMLSDDGVAARQKQLIDNDLGVQLPFQQLTIETVPNSSNIPGELGQMVRGEYTTPNGEKIQPLPESLAKVTDILYGYSFGTGEEQFEEQRGLIGTAYDLGLSLIHI